MALLFTVLKRIGLPMGRVWHVHGIGRAVDCSRIQSRFDVPAARVSMRTTPFSGCAICECVQGVVVTCSDHAWEPLVHCAVGWEVGLISRQQEKKSSRLKSLKCCVRQYWLDVVFFWQAFLWHPSRVQPSRIFWQSFRGMRDGGCCRTFFGSSF